MVKSERMRRVKETLTMRLGIGAIARDSDVVGEVTVF